ncbi:hypothetical protein BpHYR1_021104 [Brachionus plicatilis]|uniref:Uncharacterized protein n=1 Tax=Brachionus plicatilis TaxID=10195 RepID=A0A3M7P8K7_BRAPC|nr:hypothetical protein BpHYR1_021104 [Brachionus plicatilis]
MRDARSKKFCASTIQDNVSRDQIKIQQCQHTLSNYVAVYLQISSRWSCILRDSISHNTKNKINFKNKICHALGANARYIYTNK